MATLDDLIERARKASLGAAQGNATFDSKILKYAVSPSDVMGYAGPVHCRHCGGQHWPGQTCVPRGDLARRMADMLGLSALPHLDRRGLPIYRVKAGSAPCSPSSPPR